MASIRKHLVNAFTKEAKARGWHDSAINPRGLAHCGFKSARQWGRLMADHYFNAENLYEVESAIAEMIEDAARHDMPLTQADFDAFVEEEISCW